MTYKIELWGLNWLLNITSQTGLGIVSMTAKKINQALPCWLFPSLWTSGHASWCPGCMQSSDVTAHGSRFSFRLCWQVANSSQLVGVATADKRRSRSVESQETRKKTGRNEVPWITILVAGRASLCFYPYRNVTGRLKTLLQCAQTHLSTEISPLTPELNPSAQRCLTRFFTGEFGSWTVHFVHVCKTNKCNNYSFSLIMYGVPYMFRHYIAIFKERS
jgi:hypothetical protein